VTIAAGDTYADVTIAVIDDSIAESTETVILNVTSSDDYVTGSGSATLFIWDNDVGTGSGVYYWTGVTSTAWLTNTNWVLVSPGEDHSMGRWRGPQRYRETCLSQAETSSSRETS
jgi:hypothetical protein